MAPKAAKPILDGMVAAAAWVAMDKTDLDLWFINEILPLEPMLLRFLRRNWRDEGEIADLRQEAYVRIFEAATHERPLQAKAFLFQIVRNLIIDRVRQKSVVPIELLADFEWLNVSSKEPTPEHYVAARQQLRTLQAALDELPPRCRQVIVLRKIDGLSQREVAKRMGISEETVEHHVVNGIRILAKSVYGSRGALIARARRYAGTTGPKVN